MLINSMREWSASWFCKLLPRGVSTNMKIGFVLIVSLQTEGPEFSP